MKNNAQSLYHRSVADFFFYLIASMAKQVRHLGKATNMVAVSVGIIYSNTLINSMNNSKNMSKSLTVLCGVNERKIMKSISIN